MRRIFPILAASLMLFHTIFYPFKTAGAEELLPGPPGNLTFYNLTGTSVRLEWSPPEYGSIDGYNVYKNGQYLYSPVFTFYDVTGLEPGTTYTFKVSAYNEYGEGPFSNEVTVTTKAEGGRDGNACGSITYPEEGQRLKSLDRVEGTAWDEDGTVLSAGIWIFDGQGRYLSPDLSSFQYPQDPTDYLIPVKNTGTNYSTWELDLSDCPALTDGEYRVELCVNDSYWNTEAAEPLSVIVDGTPPQPPSGLYAEEITADGLKLFWQPSASQDVEGYRVYADGEYYAYTEQTSIKIQGLSPNTRYSFHVTSTDGLNESQPSTVIEISTLPGNPGNGGGIIEYPGEGARLSTVDRIYGTAEDDEGIWGAYIQVTREGDGLYLSEDAAAFTEVPCSIQVLDRTDTLHERWEFSIPDSTLFTEDTYTVTLSVYDGEINRADSITFSIDRTPPLPPENITASLGDDGSISVTWSPVADPHLECYYIYVNGQQAGITADTRYTLHNPEKGKEYTFSVRAWDGLYLSDPGEPASIIVPAEGRQDEPQRDDKSPVRPVRKYLYPLKDGTYKVKVKVMDEWLEDALRQQQEDSLIVDATNYFPGKQISQEIFWLEEDLLQSLIDEGRDLTISGKLGCLRLDTSSVSGSKIGEPLQVTLSRERSPLLRQFIHSRRGFRLLSDTLNINFNLLIPITLVLDIATPEAGDVGRIGLAAIGEDGVPHCRYDGVKADPSRAEFTVDRPGTYACIAYKTPYPDIEGHWAEKEIYRILSLGLYPWEGPEFMPDRPVTLQEFRQLVRRGLGVEMGEDPSLYGRDGGCIRREEMAKMAVLLYSSLAGEGALHERDGNLVEGAFKDLHAAEPHYKRYIMLARSLGLMEGLGDGRFGPHRYTTRAEAVTVLWRLMSLKEVENKKTLKNQIE